MHKKKKTRFLRDEITNGCYWVVTAISGKDSRVYGNPFLPAPTTVVPLHLLERKLISEATYVEGGASQFAH